MRPPHPVPHLRDYLRILTVNWLVIVIATVVSAGAGWVAILLETPKYTASVDLFATVAGDSGVRSAQQGDLGATARMSTYQQLAVSTIVLQRTVDQLKLPISAAALAGDVLVTLKPQSVVLHLEVSAPDSTRAINTANALSGNLARISQEVESTDQGPAAQLVPVGGAMSAHRVRGSILDALAVGAGIGFALSAVLVLARELLRDRLLHRAQLSSFVEQVMSRDSLRKIS